MLQNELCSVDALKISLLKLKDILAANAGYVRLLQEASDSGGVKRCISRRMKAKKWQQFHNARALVLLSLDR
jgi:hypothetical protein